MGLPTSLPGAVAGADAPSTPILSRPPLVSFSTRQVDPPSPYYVTIIDSIHLSAWSSATGAAVVLSYSVLRADGVVLNGSLTVAPPSNRTRVNQFAQLPEGFLLSCAVVTTGNGVRRGALFVSVGISTTQKGNGNDRALLVADYITTANGTGWPGGRQISPTEGPGNVVRVSSTAPSSFTTGTVSVPSGARWRMLHATAGFTTSAVVANRRVALIIAYPSGDSLFAWTPIVQTAGQIATYQSFSQPTAPDAAGGQIIVSVPEMLPLTEGTTVQFSGSGFDAGDLFTTLSLTAEEWLEPDT